MVPVTPRWCVRTVFGSPASLNVRSFRYSYRTLTRLLYTCLHCIGIHGVRGVYITALRWL